MAVQTFYNTELPKIQAEYAKDIQERLKTVKTEMDNTMLAILLLNMERFDTGNIDRWKLHNPSFKVNDLKDFRKIHQALGECQSEDEGNIEPAPGTDGRERMVIVTVCPKDKQFQHITFKYEKQLPKPDKRKGENQPKCRLKTVTVKRTIVECNNKND